MNQLSCSDFLYEEKITYSNHVTHNSTSLSEVGFYSRTFYANISYSYIEIKLTIPFSGNCTAGQRSRIILYLDDEPIQDLSIYSATAYPLLPVKFDVIKKNLTEGSHRISIHAAITAGILYIPHYNNAHIEGSIEPHLFSTLSIIGFK